MKQNGYGARWLWRCAATLLAVVTSLALAVPGAWATVDPEEQDPNSVHSSPRPKPGVQDTLSDFQSPSGGGRRQPSPTVTMPTIDGVRVKVTSGSSTSPSVSESVLGRPGMNPGGLSVSTVPAHRPHGQNPKVELNTGKKTGAGGISYKLSGVRVADGTSLYVVVEVDSGWFTVSDVANVPASLQSALVRTLDVDNRFGGALVKPGLQYRYTAFKGGNSGFPSSDLEKYLQSLTFHPGEGRTQTVSVSASSTLLQASYYSSKGGKTYDAHLLNGHGYTFIDHNSSVSDSYKGFNRFDKVYAGARFVSFLGGKGHLLTLESQGENNLVHNLFGKKSGWIGGARHTHETAKANEDTFVSTCEGQDWYWVTGPSSGKKFWNGSGTSGTAVPGVYANWASGHPGPDACYVHYDESGEWRAAKYDDSSARGFYVEFDELDPHKIGRVTETVKIFDVKFDLRDVTDDGSINRVLEGMYYATKLTADAGRGLDASTLSVTVGGKPLTLNRDFIFDEPTGTLTILASKVTGDVGIAAKAKRLVTLRNTWDPKPSVTLPVPNGRPLDETSLNEAANKHLMKDGYRLRGYLKDGVKWNFQTPITEDVTLNPDWELEAPVVTIKPPTARQEHRNAQVELQAEAKLDKVSNATFTYQWSKDGVTLPDKTSATLTVTDPGTYTVTVTVTDPATNVSSQAKAMATVAAPHQRTVTLKGRDGFESVLTKLTVTNGDKLIKGRLDEAAAQNGYTITKYTKPDGSEWSFRDGVRSDLILHPYYELKAPTVTVTAKPPKLTSVGDTSTLNARVIPPVPNATITYRWFKDGASITGATDSTHQTTQWGMYLVEVTVTDPRTGMSSKGSTSVTVGAPDKHRVTVREKDGTHVYLTLDVHNGGTVDESELSSVKKDGYVLAGWVKADGSPFRPGKDKVTGSLTISPVWKPGEPAKPKKVLTDTGLTVVAPAVAAALLLTAAGALVALRRRRNR